jgi:glycosyltransferase involved in cell wall biosynthesis
MRVLHFGKYWRQDGGIETHVKTLCRGLAELGVEVVDLVSSLDKTASDFVTDGFRVVEAPTLGIHFSTSINPSMVAAAHRLQQEKPFDVVHLHFPDPMSHLASMVLPKSIPRVISWHSDIIKQKKLLKLYRPFQRHSIMQASALIAATDAHYTSSEQIPTEYPQQNRHVIPFGMDFGKFQLTPKIASQANKIRSQAADQLIVFALGRHVSYKGFDVLIRAMKTANAYLILGGDGPLTSELRQQVNMLGLTEKVQFTGRISNEDLPAYYHACDIFCLPSVTTAEAFGIVQLEAMACGKPVICTQLNNGVNEVNIHGLTGLTVPPHDANSLALAINQLQMDVSLRQELGHNAIQLTIKKYSTQQMVNQHYVIYENLRTFAGKPT